MKVIKNPLYNWCEYENLLGLENKNNIIKFRNNYSHGATPEDTECQEDINKFKPVLMKLINSSLFLKIELIVSNIEGVYKLEGKSRDELKIELEENHSAALLPDKQILDLWPLALFVVDTKKDKGYQFFYFNSIKNEKIEELNYEFAYIDFTAERL